MHQWWRMYSCLVVFGCVQRWAGFAHRRSLSVWARRESQRSVVEWLRIPRMSLRENAVIPRHELELLPERCC